MATAGKGKKLPSQTRGSGGDFYIPPLPVAVARPVNSLETDIVGWIAATILIGLLLPLLGFLYADILTTKRDVQIELAKVQQLRRQIEIEKRKTNE
jgi:hypothetical protein